MLKKIGGLAQSNLQGQIKVLVFVDKDDDDFHGRLLDEPHLIYTAGTDVESEIVNNADLIKAVANSFSLSRDEARRCVPEAPADQLATVWSEWISYRLASEHYSISDCRFSVDSQINDSGYSQTVNPEKLEKILKNLDTSNERWKESLRMARKHVLTNIEEKQSVKLVKGKWLP